MRAFDWKFNFFKNSTANVEPLRTIEEWTYLLTYLNVEIVINLWNILLLHIFVQFGKFSWSSSPLLGRFLLACRFEFRWVQRISEQSWIWNWKLRRRCSFVNFRRLYWRAVWTVKIPPTYQRRAGVQWRRHICNTPMQICWQICWIRYNKWRIWYQMSFDFMCHWINDLECVWLWFLSSDCLPGFDSCFSFTFSPIEGFWYLVLDTGH